MKHRIAYAAAVLACTLALSQDAASDWGADSDGEGPKMVAEIQGDLVKIVSAEPDERPERVTSFLERGGKFTVEAIKRFRTPELRVLFETLLDHPDWHLQHRGLLALEYLGDPVVLERAWRFLAHPQRRLREKAAITCIRLWDGREPPGDLDVLIRDEREEHVRRALEALKRRIEGSLTPTVLLDEYVVKLENGLEVTPFLGAMKALAEAAPGYAARPLMRDSKSGASGRAPADRWVTPILGYAEEEVPLPSMQPFASLSADGTVHHVGQDMAACVDGAGVYACADGVVRALSAGSEAGGAIAVEHQLPGGRFVTALYLHAGSTVFVDPGESVTCGQLLGTVGLGFSIENGGEFAHLHFGIYPGPYDARRTYAYKPVSAGLRDWFDPEAFLPAWIERTERVVPELFAPSEKLEPAVAEANKGAFGRAYSKALKLRDRSPRRSDDWANADEVVQAVKRAPRRALRRAEALVDGGYPRDAVAFLEELRAACKGMPGVEKLEEQLLEWKEDDRFQLALKGQPKVEAAEKKALRERNADKRKAMWEKLQDKYGRTCLAERIREQAER